VNVYEQIRIERERAHDKHGVSSMEALDPLDLVRLAILVEEFGEVAREFNEARRIADAMFGDGVLANNIARDDLRAELIQVAAMAAAWADNLRPT
jgi:NTP pyrophosphatase (non-canonical NTP hydrolase)